MHLDRRTFLGAMGATTAATVASPLLAGEASAAPRVGGTLARGLRIPWGIAFLPNGDALVGERVNGRVHRVDPRGGRRRVGDVDEAVAFGEGGLLGIAVSPNFSSDRWVYFYVTTSSDNRVVRRQYVGGELGPSQVLLDGIARTHNGSLSHHGGRLAFGPSGHLFVSTGDAGLGARSQDNGSLNGKILRLDADGSIPSGNPIGGNPMWTKGHRNVQGLAWDGRGRMWASEFGQATRDELNQIVAGGNYGWPDVEGGDGDGPVHDPFVTWRPTSTCSPSGIAYAGGRIWLGALAGRSLYSVKLNAPRARRIVRHFHNRFGRIRTVQRAPDGSLWVTTSNSTPGSGPAVDKVIRIHV